MLTVTVGSVRDSHRGIGDEPGRERLADPSSCVLMKQLGSSPSSGPPTLEKPRKLGKGLGRVPRKVHVARTYKPAPNKLDNADSTGNGTAQSVQLLSQSTSTMITTTDTCNNSGGSFTTESLFASFSNAGDDYCKETAFNSSTMPSSLSIRNSYKISSDRPPPNFRRLYPTKEEVIFPTEKAPPVPVSTGTGAPSVVNSVVTNNVVTFGDGSTLSTTTNFSPIVTSNMYPYAQTLPTTYVRTPSHPGARNTSLGHNSTRSPVSAATGANNSASLISDTSIAALNFPTVPEAKGSPIPYTMDRLLGEYS